MRGPGFAHERDRQPGGDHRLGAKSFERRARVHRKHDADRDPRHRNEWSRPEPELVNLTDRFADFKWRDPDLPRGFERKEGRVTDPGEEACCPGRCIGVHQAEPLQGSRPVGTATGSLLLHWSRTPCRAFAPILDLMLLHLAVQRRPVQAEDLRRLLLVPVGSLERLQDRHAARFRPGSDVAE